LHINLEAPLDWRIVRIAEKYDKSFEEAEKIIVDVDRKRKQFREYFEGKIRIIRNSILRSTA
jgi:cytidylate kinase